MPKEMLPLLAAQGACDIFVRDLDDITGKRVKLAKPTRDAWPIEQLKLGFALSHDQPGAYDRTVRLVVAYC